MFFVVDRYGICEQRRRFGKMKNLLRIFGGDDPGLKAKDLEDNQGYLLQAGFSLPDELLVMAVEVFDQWTVGKDFNSELAIIAPEIQPDFIRKINEEILPFMPHGVLFAMRSSARSERGGIGFIVPGSLWLAVMKMRI